MKDIARRVGCSVSTVSRALRNDRRISPQVRERIAGAAEELGYAWDKEASNLMARFRSKATGRDIAPETVALVHAGTRSYSKEDPLGFWTALTRAAELVGFKIDEFALDPRPEKTGESGRRLSRVLRNRGIRGLVLFPFYQPDIRHWRIDWD